MVTNAVNTELTPEFLETLAKEERTELLDYLNNYPFIRWMISPDRPYAKDLERDSEGKIIVNVVKPHILENMDYFRKPALAFKKHGKYTNLRPNGNPNSPYMKWLRKEVLKCWYGCKRPSDGEWITGYHYFYLNYSPIERATANIKDTNAVNRVVDFPDIYDGDYIFFHYINQARYGGMYNEYKGGQHSALIAARGKGKMLPNSTIVYTPDGYKIWKDIHPGDYLYGDNGKPTKVLEEFNHKSKPIYKLTLKDGRIAYAGLEHLWTIKYGNKLLTVDTQWIIENGFGKRIIKGKCHKPIECRAFLPINKAIEIPYKKVSIDPYLLGLILGDGCLGYANSKGVLFSSTVKDQKIYESLLNTKIREYKDNNCFIEDADIKNKLIELCLYKTKSDNKFIPDIYKYNSKEVRLEVLKGLMDTDGSAFSNGIEYISKSKQLAEDVLWLGRSLGIRGTLTSKFVKYKDEIKEYFRVRFITTKTIFKLPRKIEKIKQRNSNYLKNQENYVAITSIEYSHNEDAKCVIVDNDSHLFLMNDFIVTHNSFKVASMATRNFILGENKEVCEKVKSVVVASNTEYLRKDGTLNKILAMTDFLALNTQYPSSRLKSSNQEMHWIMGFKDTRNKDVALGTRNEIIGLSLNNDSDKARGKRSHLMIWEEFGMFPGFIDAWNTSRPNVEEGGYSFGQAIALGTGGCICAGSKVFTSSGDIKNIEDLKKEDGIIGYNTKLKKYSKETISYIQPLQKKECLEIITSFNKKLRCSIDHPIFVKGKFIEAGNLKIGDRIKIVEEIPLFGTYNPKYPRVIGWVIGDGSYGNNQSTRLSNCEPEILDFIKNNFEYNIQREYITKLGKTFQEIAIKGFNKYLREEGIYGQTKLNKTFPNKIGQYSKEALSELIGGFFDTDGYVNLRKADNKDLAEISISSASKELLSFLGLLLIKFGIHGRIRERLPRKNNPKDKHSWFEYTISDSVSLLNFCHNIKLYPKVKQERLNKIKELFSTKKSTSKREEKIIDIKNIGLQTIYNLTADNTHTYIANGIVTHNTEGSDFSGALEMIYNPLGYNVYGVPNMFDKGTSGGSKSILFIGEYMNRKGCYDKNGNSDVIKAVLEEVKERVFIKYNSTDPSTIAQRIAEHPMSIQEAVMRRDGTLFPVADLTDHLNYIESNKIEWHRGHLVGELYQDPEGNISFRPTDDDPIRDFPLKDNRHKGALEIYELPKEVNGKVPSYRYVGGIDPIDDDHSTTVSLPSIFILDMFTDRIVAEYTGRPDFADDFYEICRRLAIFYNASLNYENDKKGLFTYFSNHHCTHLLCDTPDILRDVELVKSSMYGNKAHPYDQLVYTPKGLQKWEEIQIGDYLFDTKGDITKVIDIPFNNKTDIYRLTLKDGRTIEASSNHLWKVIDYNGLIKVKSTLELKENLTRNKGKYKESIYYIPKNEGVEFKKQEIPLNPYFLGLLLGDGTFSCITKTQVKFASCIPDMEVYMNILGYKYKTWDDRHHNIYYDNIKEIIKSLGLIETRSKTKFIPDIYKYNSKEIRLELLRGLLDTDGYCDKNGNCNYSSISKQLAEDVLFLARSLGINGNILEQSNKYGPIYLVRFYTDIRLFNLPRKYQKQKITKTRAFKIGITNIEYIGQKQAKCVTVDSEDHCYLIGDFVTTHNSKGTNSGKQVNAYARRLIRDWLLMPVKQTKVELDEHGDEVEKITTVKNLQRLRGIALIKELIMWNPDINADRVSALGMLMIIRENNMKYLPGEGTSIGKKARKNYLGNDPFFTSNFANNSFW
ncbi:LAGLIDADG family homing endonuclease [uncultured Fusobacterium sp.]|uniref:LAGLIDADG family homing endonuclease n=1 Tax=uncultured Fusobacterium sp. TaxID=159267 RepID=UPI0025F13479|nr:LAGLIDADG family homing endonuclease [uncultured Fusobacterium sp.]